ncbi:ABC transporter permease subunit [Dankookia sp. P2]|uniref:ABC transporter permease subunit n=1 Tax=Dankookia sp. P2 TaxID=3423955 RepID=UPI003D672A92
MRLGLTEAPLPLLYTDAAMYLGMVHAYLPFAVLPLTATLLRRDLSVEEAAADLGASPWVVFRTVTLPLSAPGAAAAFLLVFIPAAGEFVIPGLLGPPDALLVGRVLWAEFFQNRDWPLAAALAVALLALLILPIRLFQRLEEGGLEGGFAPFAGSGAAPRDIGVRRLGLIGGLAFLWLPILLLVGYAFSADRIPFQWGGFSLRWFRALAANERMLEAAWLSLRIAAGAATLAVLLGGMTGWVLARHGRFHGKALFGALAGAPLVLPEVVTGLSLLLLFVVLQGAAEAAFGWQLGRGAATVLLAHATLGLAYVAVVVQARLTGLDPALEEAAADLGAGPFTVFRTVTLPLIAPALVAGWLLAFTLSLDDVVVASFVSGPAGTTLPMLVFSQLRVGLTPEINALAAVILAVAGLLLGLAAAILGRNGRGGARAG